MSPKDSASKEAIPHIVVVVVDGVAGESKGRSIHLDSLPPQQIPIRHARKLNGRQKRSQIGGEPTFNIIQDVVAEIFLESRGPSEVVNPAIIPAATPYKNPETLLAAPVTIVAVRTTTTKQCKNRSKSPYDIY
jgi:hypothetical protein